MQEHKKTFETLEQELLERLKERGCSSVTITGYRYLCNSIISWLQDNGYDYYTEEGGIAFLQDYLKTHGNNQYYKNLRTAIYRLNDLTIGSWKNVHSDKGKKFFLSAEFKDIVDKYCFHEENKGLTAGTIKYKRYAISWFLHELEKRKCCSLLQITPEAVIMSCTRITYHSLWGEIKLFLRYLVAEGKIDIDYSTLVPHYSRPYVIPSIKSFGAISKIGKPVNQTELCNANCKCKEELSTSKGYIEFFVDGKKRKILIDEILYIDSCNSIRTRNFKVITDNKINLDIERFDKYQKNN